MMNWTEYHHELLGCLGEMAKLSPDTIKGYQGLSSAGPRTGNSTRKSVS